MPSGQRRVNLAGMVRRRVLNTRGETLGRIDELMIDLAEGRVDCATLRLQTEKTDGELAVVIPWSQFHVSSDGEHLVLDFSLAVLESVAARRMPHSPPPSS